MLVAANQTFAVINFRNNLSDSLPNMIIVTCCYCSYRCTYYKNYETYSIL